MSLQLKRVAVIGFGEAGSILGEDLAKAGLEVAMYDVLLEARESREAMLRKAAAAQVCSAASSAEAVAGSDLTISAVTASSSQAAAAACAPALRGGQLFLDINSVAPATKRATARIVERTGADYVEAAVMAPVPPQRLAVAMLLGGRRATELAAALRELGMSTTAIADEVGIASAVKMCRSILIKGLEALTLESMLAARHFGAEQQVLASLERTFPGMGWTAELPDYLVSRIAEHGRRRAAEMREVARTLEDAGFEPLMASAIAQRHDALADAMAAAQVRYASPFSWRALADALAAHRT